MSRQSDYLQDLSRLRPLKQGLGSVPASRPVCARAAAPTSPAPLFPDPSAAAVTAAGPPRAAPPSCRPQRANPRPLEAGPAPSGPAPRLMRVLKLPRRAPGRKQLQWTLESENAKCHVPGCPARLRTHGQERRQRPQGRGEAGENEAYAVSVPSFLKSSSYPASLCYKGPPFLPSGL